MAEDTALVLIQASRLAPDKPQPLAVVALNKRITEFVKPLGLDPQRFYLQAIKVLNSNPKLAACNLMSVVLSIQTAAELGLDLASVLGQGYLIPYKDTCQFIPGYRGYIELARRSGTIDFIDAVIVHKYDVFRDIAGAHPDLIHEKGPFGERGAAVAVYALAWIKGVNKPLWTTIEFEGEEGIIAIRDNSQGYKQAISNQQKYGGDLKSPWATSFLEMAKKTAIRRLAKLLPLSPKMADALELDNIAEAEIVTDEEPKKTRPILPGRNKSLPAPAGQDEPEPQQEAPREQEQEKTYPLEPPRRETAPAPARVEPKPPARNTAVATLAPAQAPARAMKQAVETKQDSPWSEGEVVLNDVPALLDTYKAKGVTEKQLAAYLSFCDLMPDGGIDELAENIIRDLINDVDKVAPECLK